MIAMLRISMFQQTLARKRRLSGEARLHKELRQADLGAGAEMADDFGSAQAADLAANGKRQIAGQAVEETAGVEVAGSGGVDDAGHRCRRDAILSFVCKDQAAGCTTSECRDFDMAPHRVGGSGEVGSLVKRADLCFVGEKDVDM